MSNLQELVADTGSQRREKEVDNIRKLLDHSRETNAPIEIVLRLGKFNEKRKRPRYLLLTLSHHWAYKNILKKSHKLKDFCYANVFITRALTKEESEKEKRLFERRFELINEGTKKMKRRINNLRLFVKGEEIVVD